MPVPGMVLEERKTTGEIVVAALVPGGACEKSGVGLGDTLIATSAGEVALCRVPSS